MRDEYLMNDNGKIYMGGFRSVKSRPWVFGQFDDCMLPTACLLLEMSRLTHSERGNPFKVARAISSMVRNVKLIFIKALYIYIFKKFVKS